MPFHTPYANPCPKDAGALGHFPEPPAKQEFARESDINVIMSRYEKSGHLPPADMESVYADFSDVGELQDALARVDAAREAFMTVPADIREKCGNDPVRFMGYLQDPKNADELREVGILKGVEVPQGQVIVETLKTIADRLPAPPAKEAK